MFARSLNHVSDGRLAPMRMIGESLKDIRNFKKRRYQQHLQLLSRRESDPASGMG